MRAFIITVSLAIVSAAPGYNYQNQQPNSLNFQPNSQGLPFLQDSHISQVFSGPAQGANQNFAFHQQHQQQQHQQQSSNFNGLQSFGGQEAHQFNHQRGQIAPVVTKDIYVHAPPEEPEDEYNLPPAPIQPPRKHYRIVFIKAPTQRVSPASLRITQAPTEEKTIIYVLSKKPDPLDLQTVFQDIAPKQQSKPEVYFIKYKTKEEAAHAQRTIQAQYDQLGGTSDVSDEGIAPITSVIGSLDNLQQTPLPGTQYGSPASTGSSFDSSNSNDQSSYLPPNH